MVKETKGKITKDNFLYVVGGNGQPYSFRIIPSTNLPIQLAKRKCQTCDFVNSFVIGNKNYVNINFFVFDNKICSCLYHRCSLGVRQDSLPYMNIQGSQCGHCCRITGFSLQLLGLLQVVMLDTQVHSCLLYTSRCV